MSTTLPGKSGGMQPRSLGIAHYLNVLLAVVVLAGCGGDGNTDGGSAASNSPATGSTAGNAPTAAGWQGHFFGTVKIGNSQYYGDALLTVDGALWLYVGGPYAGDGTVQKSRAEGAVLLVGQFSGNGKRASGSGDMIGLNCASPAGMNRFCGINSPTRIDMGIGINDGQLQGELRVATNAGEEIWSLDLSALDNYYVLPAAPARLAGRYHEVLAEFAGNGDTVVIVDDAGRLSLQGMNSGCVGTGTLTPHLDGKSNVYDVALVMDNCREGYGYLNGGFRGMATTSPSSYWDYDSLLRVWLTKPGAATPAALTMVSE
jgi:hypothetical protein